MLRGFFGNLIFAIIARMLCGNHLKYLRNEEIFENSESIFSFLLIQTTCLCFNMALIGKMGFLSQYHFIMMGPISVQKFAYFCLQDFKPMFFSRVKFVALKKKYGVSQFRTYGIKKGVKLRVVA